jgi:hypothetical protein
MAEMATPTCTGKGPAKQTQLSSKYFGPHVNKSKKLEFQKTMARVRIHMARKKEG